jgi:hypothetical protein
MSAHPLIERARTSRGPAVALVGFSIEPLGDCQAVGWLDDDRLSLLSNGEIDVIDQDRE